MKRIFSLALFLVVITSCASMKDSSTAKRVTATGTIEKSGMSTYQYGTHVLKGENKSYALRAGSIDLDLYLNKKVTIKGISVLGYPIEGGPEYVEVKVVKF